MVLKAALFNGLVNHCSRVPRVRCWVIRDDILHKIDVNKYLARCVFYLLYMCVCVCVLYM